MKWKIKWKHMGEKKYSFTHKRMAKTTEKGSKIMGESIDRINATSVMLEEK
jgi:hypothetical protein